MQISEMQKKNNKIMKMKRKGGNDEYAPNVKTTEEIENNSTIANLVQIGKLNFFTPYLVQYAISLLMNRLIFSFSITTVYLCNYARKLGYSCKRQMRKVELGDNIIVK